MQQILQHNTNHYKLKKNYKVQTPFYSFLVRTQDNPKNKKSKHVQHLLVQLHRAWKMTYTTSEHVNREASWTAIDARSYTHAVIFASYISQFIVSLSHSYLCAKLNPGSFLRASQKACYSQLKTKQNKTSTTTKQQKQNKNGQKEQTKRLNCQTIHIISTYQQFWCWGF